MYQYKSIGAISQARLQPKKITSQEAQAPKDLVQDENILVLQDDKGKATDRADYNAKVGQLLNEEGT